MKILAGGRGRRGGTCVGACSHGWITDSSSGDVALQRCFPPNIDADLMPFRIWIVDAAVGIGFGPKLSGIVIVIHDTSKLAQCQTVGMSLLRTIKTVSTINRLQNLVDFNNNILGVWVSAILVNRYKKGTLKKYPWTTKSFGKQWHKYSLRFIISSLFFFNYSLKHEAYAFTLS